MPQGLYCKEKKHKDEEKRSGKKEESMWIQMARNDGPLKGGTGDMVWERVLLNTFLDW